MSYEMIAGVAQRSRAHQRVPRRMRVEDLAGGDVAITTTRYGGTYEGGPWVAHVGDLPPGAYAEDSRCEYWWTEWAGLFPLAVGDTPNDALDALLYKLTLIADALDQVER